MNIRPSSLPMLEQCPHFESGEKSEKQESFLNAGTERHAALADLLSKDDARMARIPHFDQEAVKWAAEYIWTNADIGFTTPMIIEETRGFWGYNGMPRIEGTPDIVCGANIFDLKTRYRDYSAQMAAYALMRFEDEPTLETVTTHLLFCEGQIVEIKMWTKDEAFDKVLLIVGNAMDRDMLKIGPKVCDYCGWCDKRLTCPAIQAPVKALAIKSEGWSDVAALDPAELDAEELAQALTMRKIVTAWLKAWGDEVRDRAIAKIDAGESVPGWGIQERKGRQEVSDILEAQQRLRIDASAFIAVCKVSVTDLVELYGSKNGLNASAAKREVLEKLAPVLKQGEPTRTVIEKESK